MQNVTPRPPRFRMGLMLVAVIVGLAVIFALFPRAWVIAGVAARQLRTMWWLILLAAVGVWLVLPRPKKGD